MKNFLKLTMLILLLIVPNAYALPSEILAILGETRGEFGLNIDKKKQAMVMVGEVIRRRKLNDKIFSSLKNKKLEREIEKDRIYLLNVKKVDIVKLAERAWLESEFTNFTKDATHFESVDFKTPTWAYAMNETVRYGKHIFYKEK